MRRYIVFASVVVLIVLSANIAHAVTFDVLSFGGSADISNSPPVVEDEDPSDESIDILVTLATVSVTIEEPNGNTFNWTINGSFITNANANGASNGTKSANVIGTLEYSTEYTWYVNATDGTYWTNNTFTFTTEFSAEYNTFDVLSFGGSASISSNACPSSSSYSIANGTTNVVIIPHS